MNFVPEVGKNLPTGLKTSALTLALHGCLKTFALADGSSSHVVSTTDRTSLKKKKKYSTKNSSTCPRFWLTFNTNLVQSGLVVCFFFFASCECC